jgi:16S rRNA (cytosine1402-N4)-methyltransferase
MPKEVVAYLNPHPGQIVLDATVGGGGHAALLLRALQGEGTLVGIDQDPAALRGAEETLERSASSAEIFLLHGNFRDLDTLLSSCGIAFVDAALFDIGVSSHQLDEADRGFSYKQDTPLDMRMDPQAAIPTAADILATYTCGQLTTVFSSYGEERWASRIARFIVRRREEAPVTTGAELTEIIKQAIPASARRRGGHPAKRSFQALRIEVNGELAALEQGLEAAIRWLKPGGRLVVISFHSLEDRLVKRIFAAHAATCVCPPGLPVCACGAQGDLKVLTVSPLRPGPAETEENPRARSARLRAVEKLKRA